MSGDVSSSSASNGFMRPMPSRDNASNGSSSPPGPRTPVSEKPQMESGSSYKRTHFGTPPSLKHIVSTISPNRRSQDSQKFELCNPEFKRQHLAVVRQLKTHNKYVINPRNSKWVPYWDAGTFACLLYTVMVTPIEVCFFEDTSYSLSTNMLILFICNRVVDTFFVIDLLINFCMAYQESQQDGGRWVTNHAQIRSHYLRTWFFVDAFSMLPFELIMQIGLIASNSQSSLLRLVRTVRLLRLVKLLRVLRASRILARWKSYFGISYASLSMIKFFTAAFFVVHLMACAWAYNGLNWTPSEGKTLAWEMSWLDFYQFRTDDLMISTSRLYIISLYVAVVAMFGGVSQLSPCNFGEYVLYALMMLLGSLVWAWVVASLCSILATLNPHSTAFQNTMDELEYFMRERGFSQAHRVRLRDFFRQTQDYSRLASYNNLMIKMSVQLRGDTALKIGMTNLKTVWYFSLDAVEKEFLAVVALNLYGAVYDVKEVLPTVDLTVVMKGMAARKLRIYTKGATLGTDCVIPDERQALRELDTANCLTFVQTSQISRRSLNTIVEHFPVAKAHLRKAGAVYTLRAAFRMYYKAYKALEVRALYEGGGRCDSDPLGPSAFGGKSRARMECARNKHNRQPVNFQDILASVERAKANTYETNAESRDAVAFAAKSKALRVRSFGTPGGEMLDSNAGDELHELRREMGSLKKGQEAEAKRSNDLMARHDVLEIRCGGLDDKLELMLSMLTSMRGPTDAKSPLAGSPDAARASCIRRRKCKSAVSSALARRSVAFGEDSAMAQPNMMGMLSSLGQANGSDGPGSRALRAAVNQAQGRAAERAELRDALDA